MFSALGVLGLSMLAGFGASAAPSSTPTDIVDGVVGGVVDEGVTMLQFVVDNYLAYILALIVIGILYGIFKKFVHIGK